VRIEVDVNGQCLAERESRIDQLTRELVDQRRLFELERENMARFHNKACEDLCRTELERRALVEVLVKVSTGKVLG